MASFGYRKVPKSTKDTLVREVFDKVAGKYDIMNDLMSLGTHRVWKKLLMRAFPLKAGMKIVDMSAGTGDISREILKREPNVQVFAIDPSSAMVREGKKKLTNSGYVKGINWIIGRGEKVPLASSSMDLYVIVFGLRNVTDIPQTLKEARRVLKKKGRLLCLEFVPNSMGALQRLYDFYSFQVLPFFGRAVVGDGEPYQYLAESIRTFPPPDQLASLIEAAGFVGTHYQDWNLVALHKGEAG